MSNIFYFVENIKINQFFMLRVKILVHYLEHLKYIELNYKMCNNKNYQPHIKLIKIFLNSFVNRINTFFAVFRISL